MTEKEIIGHLRSYMDLQKVPFMMSNAFIYNWECDFWTCDNYGLTREYEIKISLSDFKVDAKKHKHNGSFRGANYFYYVCPEGIILPEMVDKNYGLIYVKNGGLETVKKPKKLHFEMFDKYKMLAEKYSGKFYTLWLKEYRSEFNRLNFTREQFRQGLDLSEDISLILD